MTRPEPVMWMYPDFTQTTKAHLAFGGSTRTGVFRFFRIESVGVRGRITFST